MGRTEQTRQLLEDRGAVWTEEDDREIVEDFGDPEREYRAVAHEGLGLIERGERDTLVVQGPEAVPWLQGLVTNDLHELADEGSGQRNAVTDKTGRFISDMRILHIPELLVVDLEAGTLDDGLWSHLKSQIILEDVELDKRSDQTARIGVYGEGAASVLKDLADWRHGLTDLSAFDGSWARWQGTDLIAQRMVWSEIPGFELTCGVGVAPRLIEALEDEAGEPEWFGRRTFETLRIESGVPRLGVELDDSVIPLEAGFYDAISFDKGCYLGQEIIARLDTRGTPAKKLRRVVLDSSDPEDVPEVGAEIFPDRDSDRSAGEIESAVWSPRLEAPVGLAFVKRNHNDVGTAVVVDEVDARLEDILDFDQFD